MSVPEAMKRAVIALESIAKSLEKLAACTWRYNSPGSQRVFMTEPRR